MRSVQHSSCLILLLSTTAIGACTNSPGGTAGSSPTSNPSPARPPETVGSFEAPSKAGPEHPVRLAVAADGTVFASDPRVNKVLGYRGGSKVVELGGLDGPLGLAVQGGLLLVGNTGRHDVELYDWRVGRYLGVLGAGLGEVTMPNSIAIAPDGRVYVADSREDTVKVYGAGGTRVATLGGTGSGDGQFHFPVAVAADGSGIVVADQGNHRVQMFDGKGRWLRSVGSLPASDAATLADMRGRFTTIGGVALKNGDLHVLDSALGHVQVIDAAGTSKGFFGRIGDCRSCTRLAADLAFQPDGTLLVSDPLARRWVTPEEVTP